jgi:hypothetical protein
MQASIICLRLLWQLAFCAASFDLPNAGSSRAARMAMIKTTTRSSIRVKALRCPAARRADEGKDGFSGVI